MKPKGKSITYVTIHQEVKAAEWTMEIDVAWMVIAFAAIIIGAGLVSLFAGVWAKEVMK